MFTWEGRGSRGESMGKKRGGGGEKIVVKLPKIPFEFIPPPFLLPLVRPLLNFPSTGRNCSRVARIETFKPAEMFRWPAADRNINRIGF